MKKNIWFVLALIGSLFVFHSLFAEERFVWIGKFTESPSTDNIPSGWILEEKAGKPDIRIEKSGDFRSVRLRADASSFGLRKNLDVDLKETPYLNWKWKVTTLPDQGDFLNKDSDDQAAQVYIIFPRFPAAMNTDILGYLWESNSKNFKKEGGSPAWVKSRVVVLQAGTRRLHQWVQEKRNVYEDYKRLFKKEPPKVGGVAIYINSQYTQAKAESSFAEILFSTN
jgi:hypothetical protein